MADEPVTIFHAWALWADKPIPENVLLWGHHLFFWARMGKLLEALGALAIIVDLLGPERLRSYAKWLTRWSDDPKFRADVLVKGIWRIYAWLFPVGLALALISVVSDPTQAINQPLPLFDIVPPPIVNVPLVIFSLACVLTFFISMLFWMVASPMTAPLAYLLAKLLEKQNADKWIKTFGITLVLFGFHFDLLSS